MVRCSSVSSSDRIAFPESAAGKVSAVSDGTRHRKTRRGIIQRHSEALSSRSTSVVFPLGGGSLSSVCLDDCQIIGGDLPDCPSRSDEIIVEDVTDEEEFASAPLFCMDPIIEMFPTDTSTNIPAPVASEDVPDLCSDASSASSDDSDDHSNCGMPFDKLLQELNISSDVTQNPSSLSDKQIQQISAACVKSLQKHGCIECGNKIFFLPLLLRHL